jgi:EmrB/QacA subfamily drug resistance transporter
MPPAISHPRDLRWISLYILCTGMLMIVLDTTVVVVAMPSIQRDLGFTPATLAWVLNAYLIAFGGLLLLSGRLGDLIGSKRVFTIGLALFTAASLFCGLAWNAPALIAGRFVQGIGGAMASSVILAMIVTAFTETRERARAMSIFNFVAAAGGSIGVLLGGFVTQVLGWHWVFLINVPIGIATLIAAQRVVQAPPGIGLRRGLDVFGAIAITVALMLGVYAVVQIPDLGFVATPILVSAALAVLAAAAFFWRQATAAEPLVPLRLFRTRNIAASNAMDALMVAGLFGFFLLEALYLRRDLNYDALATGIAFLPIDVTIGALSLGAVERIVEWYGARAVLLAGCSFSVASMAWFALAPPGGAYVISIFLPMLLLGIGLGIAFPPLMLFAMSGTTNEDAGVASGVINTTSQVGGAFGLAILATIAAAFGIRAAFAASTVFLLAALAIALLLRSERESRQPEQPDYGSSTAANVPSE